MHRTAQGRPIDMESLAAQHKGKVALGNMGVNAGGDKLGQGGEVVKTSNERVQDYYNENPNTTRQTVSVKGSDDVDIDLDDKAEPKSKSKSKTKAKAKTSETKKTNEQNADTAKTTEKILPDGSIKIIDPSDDEGNNL